MKFQINKKWLIIFIVSVVVLGMVGFLTYRALIGGEPLSLLSPWGGEVEKPEEPKLFDKYAFPYLSQRNFEGSKIVLEKVLKEGDGFTSWVFSYYSDGRKITGMCNIPFASRLGKSKPSLARNAQDESGAVGESERKEGFPVVILIRGFVPEEIYETGMGTQNMADFLAAKGFVTLAPDFLGFGGSDMPPAVGFLSPLADRFEKVVAILNLLASIENLSRPGQNFQENLGGQVDTDNIFFWGHSNGGQLALSVLEITKQPIPTVLWAPVTKSFPYNVLYFADEAEDKGKYLRKLVSEFEKDYDTDLYSIHKYLADISAPIQLHQGRADVEVPVWWSDEFVVEMKGLGKEIEYFTYEGMDHNMSGGWQQAAEESLNFYKKFKVD